MVKATCGLNFSSTVRCRNTRVVITLMASYFLWPQKARVIFYNHININWFVLFVPQGPDLMMALFNRFRVKQVGHKKLDRDWKFLLKRQWR